MDLLLHIEDMIRTQRSLTLPRYTLDDEQANQCDGVSLCRKVQELQEALLVQGNVNNDLKRLLVSALAGNSDLAYKLVDLTSDNVNLTGKSEHLAAQKAALAEIADTAGIAADVWRAKCLAGRVVATEAARRLAVANRQIQLVKHALAHLLGERARLRRDLGQTASLLLRCLQSSAINSDSCHRVAQDTLELASLCHQLASTCHPVTKMETPFHPIVCQADSPGERLALQILMNNLPDCIHLDQPSCLSTTDASQGVREQSQVDLSTLMPVPPPPDSEDLIEMAIQSFSSSRPLGPVTSHMSACRGCNGHLTAI